MARYRPPQHSGFCQKCFSHIRNFSLFEGLCLTAMEHYCPIDEFSLEVLISIFEDLPTHAKVRSRAEGDRLKHSVAIRVYFMFPEIMCQVEGVPEVFYSITEAFEMELKIILWRIIGNVYRTEPSRPPGLKRPRPRRDSDDDKDALPMSQPKVQSICVN